MPQGENRRLPVTEALLALGSNEEHRFGGVAQILADAVQALETAGLNVTGRSKLYRTPCVPPGAGPDFANAAVRIETGLDPQALLDLLHEVENEFGRVRRERWGPRTLDIDLIAMADTVLPDRATAKRWMDLPPARQMQDAPKGLVLPHPRLQDRAFVLVPLADVASGWRHPLIGKTVATMLTALPDADSSAIVPIDWPE